MKLRRVGALFAIFVVFCFIAPTYGLASQARIVRLSLIEGNVHIERPGTAEQNAVLNMPVVQGTRVTAESDAAVEIEFENGSTLRMVGPGAASFHELSLRGEGERVTLVEIDPGTYYFNVNKKGDDDFRVKILGQDVRVRKSARFRVDAEHDVSNVAVFKGELQLEGRGEEVAVKKNETLTIDSASGEGYFVAKGVEENPNDKWDSEREDYRERYAKDETWKYANTQYGGRYSYGFTDLAYYGNFFSVPGYGWMWRPAYFDPSWDPYDNGAWMYYPGQGWIFVSMYPWGWTPYRYGQWMWVPGYGWCWRPMRQYSYWQTVPVIQGAPRGWRRPSPPPMSAWEKAVLINQKPSPDPRPTPGAWRRPTPPPTVFRPNRPADQEGKGPRVKQPTVNGRVVPRQPDAPAPERQVNVDPSNGVNKINNDAPPSGGFRRADPDDPKRGGPPADVRPRPTPPPAAPQPRTTDPPVRVAPVDRQPDRSPDREPPRRIDPPRTDPPRNVAPPPRFDPPRSSPPPPSDDGRTGGGMKGGPGRIRSPR